MTPQSVRSRFGRVTAVLALLAAGGCETAPIVPPPEAILAGVWRLTPGTFLGFTHKTLTFNAAGRLTKVETTSVNLIGQNVTVTEQNLDIHQMVGATTAKIFMTGDFVFDGTFNDTKTELTGLLFNETELFDTIITTELGPGTMTKQ